MVCIWKDLLNLVVIDFGIYMNFRNTLHKVIRGLVVKLPSLCFAFADNDHRDRSVRSVNLILFCRHRALIM